MSVRSDVSGPVSAGHVSVLQSAAVEALAVRPAGRYIDGTYGRGGHARALAERLSAEGRLLLLDRDPEAIADARRRFADDARIVIRRINFAELEAALPDPDWIGATDGLLLDLGVSSPQLDVAERGFAFARDGALDMRMDPDAGESAADYIARVAETELADVLKRYGEERYARRIAAAIVAARAIAPIRRTAELADVVKRAHPRWERHHHPATRTFQAIRIAVNGELDAIARVLQSAARVLREGGRLVIISFHSLEDRLVKRTLRRPPPDPAVPRGLPIAPATIDHPWRPLGKALRASAEEVARNPRARSAVMRVAERAGATP